MKDMIYGDDAKLEQGHRRMTGQFAEEERKTMECEWQCRRRNVFANRFLTQLEGDPPGDAVIRKEVMD